MVLPRAAVADWLDPRLTGADDALSVLAAASPELAWHEVSTRVGSVRNNDPSLIQAV